MIVRRSFKEGTQGDIQDRRKYIVPVNGGELAQLEAYGDLINAPFETWEAAHGASGDPVRVTVYRFLECNPDDALLTTVKERMGNSKEKRGHRFRVPLEEEINLLPPHNRDSW